MVWEIKKLKQNLKLKNPILIEGLPGIGNVGKLVADFLVDELKAEKYMEFFSDELPHMVFVNEDNLVELPKIEIYHKKLKEQDLLFLVGDIQPVDSKSSYNFSNNIISTSKSLKVKEIITLGGIGLPKIPKTPKVYCTSTSKETIKKYKNKKLHLKLYGIVGLIMGVSGLLVGLSKKKNIDSIALLAETYNHPMYLGINGAKEILKLINKKFELKLDLKKLDKESKKIDKQLLESMGEIYSMAKKEKGVDTTYIG